MQDANTAVASTAAPPAGPTTPHGNRNHKTHDVDLVAAPTKHTLHDESRTEFDVHAIVWLAILHAAVLISPFVFTWQALAVAVFLHWVTGGLGICLGYHRYFTHGGFETSKPMRMVLAILGGLSGEGSAVTWVANHRKHHAHSDQEGDPHSPLDGKWWSHMVWLVWQYPEDVQDKHLDKWAPDLKRDPIVQYAARTQLRWHVGLGALLLGMGYLLGGWFMAASFLVWGMFVRLCFVLHSTWFVNSASHIWGYRNYKTTDESRNNWWVAVITYGEGWHNNHHAFPRMAAHGHRWWELDMTFWAIRAMRMTGLAWNVVDYKRATDKT